MLVTLRRSLKGAITAKLLSYSKSPKKVGCVYKVQGMARVRLSTSSRRFTCKVLETKQINISSIETALSTGDRCVSI